jgi:DNA transposition AAA+ family ATPase
MQNYTMLIKEFNSLKERKKIKSMNQAARSMGISSAALSNFLRGKYEGNNADIAQKLDNFLTLLKERSNDPLSNEVRFIDTISNTEKATQLLRLIHIKGGIGLILASAGLGKTQTLTRYAEKNEDVIYLKANLAFSAKVLMQALSNRCGYSGKGHNYHLMMKIIENLKNSGRLIIIDQAEYLPEKALDMLREIQEEANIGLVLAGLPALLDNLRGRGSVNEQLITRVDALLKLKPLNDEDIKQIVRAYLPESNGLYKVFASECRRNGRVLHKLIINAKRIALSRDVEVNEEIVEIASKQLVR